MHKNIDKQRILTIFFLVLFISFVPSSCDSTTNDDYLIVEKIFQQNGLKFSKKEFETSAIIENNRVISLDLSKRNISIIPGEISELSELQKIILSNNKIKALPESFSLLSKLEFLDIVGNELTKLPDNFYQLNALKYLSISGNKIDTLPPEFGKLKQLQTLLFSHLESFSNNFSDLLSLQYVSFGDDVHTTTIPDELLQNSYIQSLTVKGDNFIKIPSKISKLRNLKILRLTGIFTDIPESIGSLNQVESMTLIGKFKTLPANISGMMNLKTLTLQSRELITLPEQIYDLENLEKINLDRNQIQYLPDGISKLKSLKEFYLGSNNLTELPADLFETKHWKKEDGYVLSIKGNKICNVTEKQDEWLKTYISPRWRNSQNCK